MTQPAEHRNFSLSQLGSLLEILSEFYINLTTQNFVMRKYGVMQTYLIICFQLFEKKFDEIEEEIIYETISRLRF